ncbi:MAG: malonyl-ACP O-methyltransferase BioC [Steroidobacteraceae bacterium]
MSDADFQLDRRALARSFDAASTRYERAAHLQQLVRQELLGRLDFFRLEPQRILDLGCGTGLGSAALVKRFPRAQVMAVDLAPGMLREARRHARWWKRFSRICADANALPLADGSVDLIFSNLMLQWCDQPDRVFAELRRVLKPGGLLLFATFGPETLRELRAAWSVVDDRPHVSLFPDVQSLGNGMMHAGLAEPVLDGENYRQFYPDVRSLMQELKSIGAHNAARERRRGLTSPRQLQKVLAHYEQHREARGLPANYEVLYGAAFGAAPRNEFGIPEFGIPVTAIGRRRS